MSHDVIEQLRANLRDHASERGIELEGRWVSWGDVARYGEAVVAQLEAAGCPPSAKVGIIIRNRLAHAAAVVGLLAHRRSISFVYPFLPATAIADNIDSLGAAAILADEQDWPNFRKAAEQAGCAGIALADIDAEPRLVEGLEKCTRTSFDDALPDGGIEVLSSGTTGTPKRIPMPLKLLERAVMSAPGAESGNAPSVQINIWPLGGVGGVCLLTGAAVNNTPLVLMERFTVDGLVDALRRHRPDTLGLNPTAIAMIMDADVSPEDMESVKSVSGGSAYLDPDLQDRFEKRYNLPILWGMGATEFCGTIVRWTPQMRADRGDSKRGSTGLPMPGVEIRAIDPESGAEVPHGAEGLLEVHCPSVRPDWVRTTDLVMIDEDGYVFHRGRFDGAIVRGGFKILPERVVDVLRQHPAVVDASVVGIPDARLGAVPVAAVELSQSAGIVDEQALLAHLRAELPPTHVPVEIRIVDALPRTPSLKVSLNDVKKMFMADAA
ncbi:class I adenylate-forming enzyme family protein [Sphingobium tyrosinilyticum]|uniref:Class I adenylate-forming enzyme family protein n=1 Tax=Sphingobium tyrosinilyticum TaxID=2715436 RepID=A0ABV9EYY2_9SPHN